MSFMAAEDTGIAESKRKRFQRIVADPDTADEASLIAEVTPGYLRTLHRLPGLHKEAELEKLARQINAAHTEIQDCAEAFIRAGCDIVERAIEVGNWLIAVKREVGHGHFEDWCNQQLTFSIRKAQYYMVLAKHHAKKNLLKLRPHSLRRALIYAGALPEDTDQQKHPPAKFDDLTRLRKTMRRFLLELKANEDEYGQQLFPVLQPLFVWLEAVKAPVDIPVEVEPVDEADVSSKTQHVAFLSMPPAEPIHELEEAEVVPAKAIKSDKASSYDGWCACDPKGRLMSRTIKTTLEDAEAALAREEAKKLADLLAEGYRIGRCEIKFTALEPRPAQESATSPETEPEPQAAAPCEPEPDDGPS